MKRLTDPTFEYVNAANTDIRKTFARVRSELAQTKPQGVIVTMPDGSSWTEYTACDKDGPIVLRLDP